MHTKSEIVQLPVCADVERLAEEVLPFKEHDWDSGYKGYTGVSAVPLIAACEKKSGDQAGPKRPTEALNRCPYLQQVIESFDTVVGHAQLIRLDPGARIPAHYDDDPGGRHHVRILIPIVTDGGVMRSMTGKTDVIVRAGEAWVFDNWRARELRNDSNAQAIHLLFHTTGTSTFWSLAAHAESSLPSAAGQDDSLSQIPYQSDHSPDIQCERYYPTTISSPDEVDSFLSEFLADIENMRSERPESYEALEGTVGQFRQDWRSQWMLHRDSLEGLIHYQRLLNDLTVRSGHLLGDTLMQNRTSKAIDVLGHWLTFVTDENAIRERSPTRTVLNAAVDTSFFDAPIFIVSAPRSGSTMLFDLLRQNRELWTIGDESHRLFESIRQLNPAARVYDSNALGADDLTVQIGGALFGAFKKRLCDSQGKLLSDIPLQAQASSLRILEKTPKNALRIPFIRKLFPNAMFIYLHRDMRANIGSIIDAWASGNFVTYSSLPDWSGPPWSLLLPQGWRELRGKPPAEIAAWQWAVTNQKIIDDLKALPDDCWHSVAYEDLLGNREAVVKGLCKFADIPFGPRMQTLSTAELPFSKYTLAPPSPDKWKRHQSAIEAALSVHEDVEKIEKVILELA